MVRQQVCDPSLVDIHLTCALRAGEREYKDAPEGNLGGIFTGDLGDH